MAMENPLFVDYFPTKTSIYGGFPTSMFSHSCVYHITSRTLRLPSGTQTCLAENHSCQNLPIKKQLYREDFQLPMFGCQM